VSVVFILPETKGISLERMDKIFGEVDYVEAGEQQTNVEKIEEEALGDQVIMDEKKAISLKERATVQEVDHV
jgi:hypothetical protein